MDFDPRWTDDPRDRDDYGRELSQGSRGGLSNRRERERLELATCSRATLRCRAAWNASASGRETAT